MPPRSPLPLLSTPSDARTASLQGLLIATIVVAIMYYGLCYCIAEMSPALPHTGGAYSFARSAMGPWGGFLTGLAENMEYVITPAVVVGAMGLLRKPFTRDELLAVVAAALEKPAQGEIDRPVRT